MMRMMLRIILLLTSAALPLFGSANDLSYTIISQAYFRSLLLPDDAVDENQQPESLVTYIKNALIDRDPSQLSFDAFNAENLFKMGRTSSVLLGEQSSIMSRRFKLGYVEPAFPENKYFIFEIARGLMSASQSSLAQSTTPSEASVFDGESAVEFLPFAPATPLQSLNDLVENTPLNSQSRKDVAITTTYDFSERLGGSDYNTISGLQNAMKYSLYSMVSCADSFQENQCDPCTGQKPFTNTAPLTFKDTAGSSCTLKPEYIDAPWNGMKPMILGLKKVVQTLDDPTYQATIPNSVLNSSGYLAYKRGFSCLVSDLDQLLTTKGDWYNFFNWVTFTSNPDCQRLVEDSGREVIQPSSQSISSMLYDYFFENPSTQDAVVSVDAMNVVNLIDGYIMHGSSSKRLTSDPTVMILRASIQILHRLSMIVDAQAARTAVDLTAPLLKDSDVNKTLLPDRSYLLYFFMNNYLPKQLDPGQTCRYMGLSGDLFATVKPDESAIYTLQNNVILDVVGLPNMTPAFVGFKQPYPAIEDLRFNGVTIPASRQAPFLKYGKFNLSARYLTSQGVQYSGVLNPSGSKITPATFSLPRLLDQIQENQKEIEPILRDHLKQYNQDMTSLIMLRLMIGYIYEYSAVSSLSAWSSLTQTSADGGADSQSRLCTLSRDDQVRISSTFRLDPRNASLAQLTNFSNDNTSSGMTMTGSSTTSGASTASTTNQSSPSADSDYQTSSSVIDELVIQYVRDMTQWNSLETLRDEAFQLAKRLYLRHLEYKMRELSMVFRAATISQQMQMGQLVRSAFPQSYSTHDNNTKSYIQVSTVGGASSDGVPTSASEVESPMTPTMQSMIDDVACSGCANTD